MTEAQRFRNWQKWKGGWAGLALGLLLLQGLCVPHSTTLPFGLLLHSLPPNKCLLSPSKLPGPSAVNKAEGSPSPREAEGPVGRIRVNSTWKGPRPMRGDPAGRELGWGNIASQVLRCALGSAEVIRARRVPDGTEGPGFRGHAGSFLELLGMVLQPLSLL